MIVSIGVPLDENSSFLRGAASGPEKIMEAFYSESTNRFTERGVHLDEDAGWEDRGNLRLSGMPQAFREIEHAVRAELNAGNKVITLGGDHSITYPLVRAVAASHPGLNILHIDAHSDLYESFNGSRVSHACPFARIMEEKLASRLVQVGIRTLNTHQREQAKKFNVEIVEMKDWRDSITFNFNGPLYISLDLDALDPSCAPGVSHYEPGGLMTRDVIRLINQCDNVVGADIVELNPDRDHYGMTAMVAAKLFKELIGRMLL